MIPSHITACWSALSGRLIVFVFAPMLMGSAASKVDKGLIKKLGGACCLSYALCALQYAVPILLCVFLLTPVFGVNPLFGTILEQGWAGGHGTAGGMALVFEELGWMDGQSLAVTSATIGLVFGIVGGVVLINIGIRKGWTAITKTSTNVEGDAKELYPDENDKPVDTHTAVAPGVVDNFAFHAALICVAVLIGWIINWALKTYLKFSVSWFVTALFGGLLLLKTCDPKFESDASTIFAARSPFCSWAVGGGVLTSMTPVWVVQYGALPVGIAYTIALIIALILPRLFGCWHPVSKESA